MDRFLGFDVAGVTAGKRAMERKKYPIRAEDYQLFEVVGQGVSASVYRALCAPLDEVVAIKIVDFERNNSDLSNIYREAQTMILIDHPNVLKAHCSFVNDHTLWVVMPYMEGGSCLHIMKSVFPNGFEEPMIATVLREVLKGLEYLHNHGHIHRDVKSEYKRGISAWNFDVEDLKAQASLVSMSPSVPFYELIAYYILAISGADDVDDKSKHPLVQRKGRFKVMSDNIDLDKIS
ncbi:hypothetical protein BHM03_00026339 [Ensete ventricosum]|uniref:Protein kinase domain-containing protein n=1 Tax=Ensete ventricosum TaxID=4639 RepID=A0A426YJP7_ENSVE|nr:hypothetical protein B296_00046723 [Ensete ventricosum]RZR97208.1 hypothetical protein BHM03_00026339 [Ensete ventricosum]